MPLAFRAGKTSTLLCCQDSSNKDPAPTKIPSPKWKGWSARTLLGPLPVPHRISGRWRPGLEGDTSPSPSAAQRPFSRPARSPGRCSVLHETQRWRRFCRASLHPLRCPPPRTRCFPSMREALRCVDNGSTSSN